MADRRALLVPVLLIALVVGGVSLLGKGSANDSGDFTSEVTPPSTTARPTTGPIPEAEWRAAITRIIDLQNEIFAAPNPRRVGEMMTTGCSCYLDTVNRLSTLQSNQEHVDGANLVIREVSLIGQPNSREVLLYVKVGSLGKRTLNAQGKTVRTAAAVDSEPLIYNLVKGDDGLWRLADRRLPEERS